MTDLPGYHAFLRHQSPVMLGKQSDVEKFSILVAARLISSRGLSFTLALAVVGYCIYSFVPIIGDEIIRPLAQDAGTFLRALLFH
jgi:hypothetical protein